MNPHLPHSLKAPSFSTLEPPIKVKKLAFKVCCFQIHDLCRYASAAPRHARAMRRLRTACSAAVTSAKLASAEFEASILSAGVGASLRRYDLEMTAAAIRRASTKTGRGAAEAAGSGVLPMPSKDVKALDAHARVAALAAFDASIAGQEGEDAADSAEASGDAQQPRRRSATTWLLKTSAAAIHRSHAEKGLEKRGADWSRRNEAAAAERCAAAREVAVAEVEADTDRLALPDLEASLRAKAGPLYNSNLVYP